MAFQRLCKAFFFYSVRTTADDGNIFGVPPCISALYVFLSSAFNRAAREEMKDYVFIVCFFLVKA